MLLRAPSPVTGLDYHQDFESNSFDFLDLRCSDSSAYDNYNVRYPLQISTTSQPGLALKYQYMQQKAFHNNNNTSSGTKEYSPAITNPRFYQDFVPSQPYSNAVHTEQFQAYGLPLEQDTQPEAQYTWSSMPVHHRSYSNGSVQSYGSLAPNIAGSPYQYPATFESSDKPFMFAPHMISAPNSPLPNLPTPTGTPTPENVSRFHSRRTAYASQADSTHRSQQSMRGSSIRDVPSLRRGTSKQGGGSSPNYSQDAPITPKTANGDEYDPQITSTGFVATRHVPKFARTETDAYQDELYDPSNQPMTQPSRGIPSYATQYLLPQQPSMVNQRLHQANEARTGVPQPQRQVSPYSQRYLADNQPNMQTAAGLREQQKAEHDARVYRQHHPEGDYMEQPTVSPKDAFPMEIAAGQDDLPSLFPDSSQQSANEDSTGFGRNLTQAQSQFNFPMAASSVSFATPSIPASASGVDGRSAQQYRPESSNSVDREPISFPAALPSMETTRSEAEDDSSDDDSFDETEDLAKPLGTTASGGTYTCTYHGCTRRFASPPQLQKHKREDHRTTGSGVQDQPQSPGALMSQAGPHRCTRKNPATGKPCNTVFSRPYDLTRHEDTIHAERKKVRCPHCVEEKLFSRADALTRHLRVVHPQMAGQGKHRRRALE